MRNAPLWLAALAISGPAFAGPCLEWQVPESVGALDPAMLNEASGVAASRTHPGRLYHINDSGDGPFVYVTDASGGATRKVTIAGFEPSDVEDLALGRCPDGEGDCLVVADIGDNARRRESLRLVIVRETALQASDAEPLAMVDVRYPDRAHDAESVAFHPSGDLYMMTKEVDFSARTSAPAQIFRLPRAGLTVTGRVQTLEPVGQLDLPRYISGAFTEQTATAMDISADGQRVAVLTYRRVFEWAQDLAQPIDAGRELVPGSDFALSPLPPLLALPQAEAIAYLPGEDGVVYSTELARILAKAPVYRQVCLRR